MKLRETYKEKISKELQDLSESEIEKIMKMIHFIKTDFWGVKKDASIESFKKARGAWKDVDIEGIFKKLNESWRQWRPSRSV
ncbi:MAG: hypothetical protein FJ241_08810 [Nitrospira sp.]|nr:hypothetical protein [Nitrospira sp.]